MKTYTFIYEGKSARLDRAVLEFCKRDSSLLETTRAQISNWIEGGRVTVAGKTAIKSGHSVRHGELVEFSIEQSDAAAIEQFEFPLSVLYEDDALIVIDKPPGISMHPGAGNRSRTLVNALAHHFKGISTILEKGERPGIVHRLDKDTSGVVVVAKTPEAHADLSRQFLERSVDRRYFAFVFTTPRAAREINKLDSGTVEGAIGRHPTKRTQMAVVPGGKPAKTHWRLVERMEYGTLIELKLDSGRTHQIRVHMNHIASPVIGDKDYGDFSGLPLRLRKEAEQFGRQALHAYSLSFTHPKTKERMHYSSEIPSDMKALLEKFRSWTGA